MKFYVDIISLSLTCVMSPIIKFKRAQNMMMGTVKPNKLTWNTVFDLCEDLGFVNNIPTFPSLPFFFIYLSLSLSLSLSSKTHTAN